MSQNVVTVVEPGWVVTAGIAGVGVAVASAVAAAAGVGPDYDAVVYKHYAGWNDDVALYGHGAADDVDDAAWLWDIESHRKDGNPCYPFETSVSPPNTKTPCVHKHMN